MAFIKGKIAGVLIIPLNKHVDERGFLIETIRIDRLPSDLRPAMSYVSCTEPGVARGPHEHRDQTDIFSFIGPGNFKVYLWDNRKESDTVSVRMTLFAGQDSPKTLVVPPGVVHAYRNISKIDRGWVFNYPDKLYAGWEKKEEVDEIRHEYTKDQFFQDFIAK